MKKILIKGLVLLLSISLITFFTEFGHSVHVHSDEVVCPKCQSSAGVSIQSQTNATCTTGGSITYLCRQNHDPTAAAFETYTWTVNTNPLDHAWTVDSSTSANCTVDGTTTYICSRCSATKTEVTEKAQGHKYTDTIIKAVSCTEDGSTEHTCQNCGYSYVETISKLGHDYKKTIIKKVSCEEDGEESYTCTHCNNTYKKTIEALGHDFKETENVEATCTEDGHITKVCKTCNKEEVEIIKALGHKAKLEVTKEATCTEEGLKTGICETCGESLTEVIPATGHTYPEEWTIEKEASIFKEGLQTKTCEDCGTVLEEVIEKKEVPAAVYGTAGGITAAGAIFFALKKAGKIGAKKATKKVSEKAVEEAIEKEILEPEFEDKVVVTSMANDAFYKAMKAQKHLSVVESEYDDLASAIEENEPALVIIDVSGKDLTEVKEYLVELKSEDESDSIVSLLVNKEQLTIQCTLLTSLKDEKLIRNYSDVNTNFNVSLVKLVLPAMKPDLKSDEALGNIGMVADALGIPGISTIIDFYTSGREIKETIEGGEEEGLSFVDKSTIIADIASILGLETVSSVAGLVGDVDDIKTSLEAKIGANEVVVTKDAVTDVVDVLSDIINK